MPYTADQIAGFTSRLNEWAARGETLREALISRAYRQEQSWVMAAQGFTRRLQTLLRCIEQVYEIVPPDAEKPSRQNVNDAAIWLQAFVINVYGAIDNLAWVWVLETDFKPEGKPLPPTRIGFKPSNKSVRGSLSAPMQEYMSGVDAWFEYLENYRDALAHRIPLYIPPKTMGEEESAEWQHFERGKFEALKARNLDLYSEIAGHQSQLGTFEPWMMHAYGKNKEDGRPVQFHPQMICDLATVVEIGEKMLGELDSIPQVA